jgi:glucose-1-phosphate cytidylyltransferase
MEISMKAVILAGGLGTRLSEYTTLCPKTMVEVGGRPILWHIMKIYSAHGINDFIVCCGYKGYMIKEYFANYYLHMSDVTFDIGNNSMEVYHERAESWRVTLVDTGDSSMTGGRLRRVAAHVADEEAFCFTYGDGVGDIDIAESIKFHKSHGKDATMTTSFPPGRFGAITIEEQKVLSFKEKPRGDGSLVNAGFFVLSPKVLSRIQDDQTIWEEKPLTDLAREGQLMSFQHSGFWQPMDTVYDKTKLEALWEEKKAPWKIW